MWESGQLSGSVTVLSRFGSWWGGVMVMERSKRAWGESLGLKKCDSHQGGVKGKHKCELMERCGCHDHGGGLRECGKVRQLSGGVTVLREV